jgi:membrane protease YdiL (CAAX protease family)
MIRHLYRYLLQLSAIRLFLLMFFFNYPTQLLVAIILQHFLGLSSTITNNESDSGLPLIAYSFYGVIIGPFIETVIFQKLILGISKHSIKNNIVCVALAGVVFGLAHMNGLFLIVLATFSGFSFGLFYTIARQNKYNAFWLTCLMHAMWNLIAFSLRYFL